MKRENKKEQMVSLESVLLHILDRLRVIIRLPTFKPE